MNFLNFLKKNANKTLTENAAVTLRTTYSDCLDLFATIGALRNQSSNEIETRFLRAYSENPDLAMKILFYARDIRGGLGERYVFRTILRYLAENQKNSLLCNMPYISEFGRWDDFLVLLDTSASKETEKFLHKQFIKDITALNNDENISLLGKWLPSVNASDKNVVKMAKQLAKSFGMKQFEYRKIISALRAKIKIIENNLREVDYTFDYEKQPSKAMFKYRKAFLRNDESRYKDFLTRVNSGEAKLHTGTLMPYEIVQAAYNANESERKILDTTWNALEDFTNNENALVVVDGSGSMYFYGEPKPAAVAQSLAIYFAERNQGIFHNHFITFSCNPQLVEIKGKDIVDKVRYCKLFDEVANTNLQAVFKLILDTAVKNKLPQKELPSTLYIISDMEFDSCVEDSSMTNFDYVKKLFASYGYELPRVIFWNVQSRNRQQPVEMNEQGVALVSGCTARIFSQVISGEIDPYKNMMSIISSERYAMIKAS